jgi:putative restriction endonuclease
MAFCILVHRTDSIYDDRPAERYQFPGIYLKRAQTCLGDWIIYYEPTKVQNSRGYFAAAKIQQIIPDINTSGMYFAIIAPGSYCPFVNPVPFSGAEGVVERGVLNEAGRNSGRAQGRVRHVWTAPLPQVNST